MTKSRIEAFSDGVLAIIITIMVLELKAPAESTFDALISEVPVLLSYTLSFVFIGIYWNNHHHLFSVVHHVNGRVLWANLHLLFWLSFTPFVTGWMGRSFEPVPVAMYGVVQFLAGFGFFLLSRTLLATHSKDSALAHALGDDRKGKFSVVAYGSAVPLAFYSPTLACSLYVIVAIVWFIPDRRIERVLQDPISSSVERSFTP